MARRRGDENIDGGSEARNWLLKNRSSPLLAGLMNLDTSAQAG
jgi:hypothetical protein